MSMWVLERMGTLSCTMHGAGARALSVGLGGELDVLAGVVGSPLVQLVQEGLEQPARAAVRAMTVGGVHERGHASVWATGMRKRQSQSVRTKCGGEGGRLMRVHDGATRYARGGLDDQLNERHFECDNAFQRLSVQLGNLKRRYADA